MDSCGHNIEHFYLLYLPSLAYIDQGHLLIHVRIVSSSSLCNQCWEIALLKPPRAELLSWHMLHMEPELRQQHRCQVKSRILELM